MDFQQPPLAGSIFAGLVLAHLSIVFLLSVYMSLVALPEGETSYGIFEPRGLIIINGLVTICSAQGVEKYFAHCHADVPGFSVLFLIFCLTTCWLDELPGAVLVAAGFSFETSWVRWFCTSVRVAVLLIVVLAPLAVVYVSQGQSTSLPKVVLVSVLVVCCVNTIREYHICSHTLTLTHTHTQVFYGVLAALSTFMGMLDIAVVSATGRDNPGSFLQKGIKILKKLSGSSEGGEIKEKGGGEGGEINETSSTDNDKKIVNSDPLSLIKPDDILVNDSSSSASTGKGTEKQGAQLRIMGADDLMMVRRRWQQQMQQMQQGVPVRSSSGTRQGKESVRMNLNSSRVAQDVQAVKTVPAIDPPPPPVRTRLGMPFFTSSQAAAASRNPAVCPTTACAEDNSAGSASIFFLSDTIGFSQQKTVPDSDYQNLQQQQQQHKWHSA